MKRKVMIIEPSEIIKTGIKALIDSSGEFEVVNSISDISFVDERIAVNSPDIIIMNPAVIAPSPKAALPQSFEGIPSAALVYQYANPVVIRLFNAVIDIHDNRETITNTLKSIESNAKKGKNSGDNSELTKRETDILILVAKGMMSKEIADKLNISIHTVISHRKNITKKTGIKSVAGLAVYAMLNNLMDEA